MGALVSELSPHFPETAVMITLAGFKIVKKLLRPRTKYVFLLTPTPFSTRRSICQNAHGTVSFFNAVFPPLTNSFINMLKVNNYQI